MSFTTRFAPSPTGPLHLGHAFSAMLAHDMARATGGRFLLRIEDIDQGRSRAEWERQIFDDLHWLGLDWPMPVMRQSDRLDRYRETLGRLWNEGLLFACSCTRRDIREAMSAPQEGAVGPNGPVYPGTCRAETVERHATPPEGTALRLHMSRALARIGAIPDFVETGAGPGGETGTIPTGTQDTLARIGDVVLSRRDMGTSYHLSVVLDDAAQGITHIVRGQDLFDATRIHVLLQHLLDLPQPVYYHHRLIRDAGGKRLAKRDDSRAIALYREQGLGPADIRDLVGLTEVE